ncbi:MAG: hypothetical protein EA381_08445 [Planctomycetaceae bacterium]|nr:MAG: hypothetical protein EA381_08445 [Planctomycetaceae bacterium]
MIRHRRRGFFLIVTIACLAVTSVLMLTMTKESLAARRQGRVERQLRQTEFLLEAGVRRATRALLADPAYAGETWQPSDALPAWDNVQVEIGLTPSDPPESAPVVTVIATLGRGDSDASRTQRSFRFPVPQPLTSPASESQSVEPPAEPTASPDQE